MWRCEGLLVGHDTLESTISGLSSKQTCFGAMQAHAVERPACHDDPTSIA